MIRKVELKRLNQEGKKKFAIYNSNFESMSKEQQIQSIDEILALSTPINEHPGIFLEERNFVSKKEMKEYLESLKDSNDNKISGYILYDPDVISYITIFFAFQTIPQQGKQINRVIAGAIGADRASKDIKEEQLKLSRGELIETLNNSDLINNDQKLSALINEYTNNKSKFEPLKQYIGNKITSGEVTITEIISEYSNMNDLEIELGFLKQSGSYGRHILLAQFNLSNKFGELVDPLLNLGFGSEFADVIEQCSANSKTRHSDAYFKCVLNIYTKESEGKRVFVSRTTSGKGNLRTFNLLVNNVGSKYDIHQLSDIDLIKKIQELSRNDPKLEDYVTWMKDHNPGNIDYLLDIIGN